MMFYAVASAVLANEVDTIKEYHTPSFHCLGFKKALSCQILKHKRREQEEEELLEIEREEMLDQVPIPIFPFQFTFLEYFSFY